MASKIYPDDIRDIQESAEDMLFDLMEDAMYRLDARFFGLAKSMKLSKNAVHNIAMKHLRKKKLLPKGW